MNNRFDMMLVLGLLARLTRLRIRQMKIWFLKICKSIAWSCELILLWSTIHTKYKLNSEVMVMVDYAW